MRAVVMRAKKLVVDKVRDPVPGAGQVLVETVACGICGSDLHALKFPELLVETSRNSGSVLPAAFDLERDVVMGHEFSARVLELGPGVTGVQPGDVVVSMPLMFTSQGVGLIGYSNDYPGGYGERMVLSAMMCIKVPDGLDPRHAALTEPMAVGLHAVNRSGIAREEGAVVLGCGPVGLAVIAALRLAGIQNVVAADFSPSRRRVAALMGAKDVVDPREEPAESAWQRVAGAAVPVVYEAVGTPGMLGQAMRMSGRNGRILVVGACMEPDTILPIVGINKELNIHFALGYTPEEFRLTLDRIAAGDIDVRPLITGELGLDGVPDAFEALANPEAHIKILVLPNGKGGKA